MTTSPPHPLLHRALVSAVVAIALVLGAVLVPVAGVASASEVIQAGRAPDTQATIAAHRGGTLDAPENTLPAFADAFDRGVPLVECDLRVSADGVPVVIHDASVDRTTDGRGEVSELTLAELRALDASAGHEAYRGVAIPTFDEFLQLLVASRSAAMIEFKGPWARWQLVQAIEAIQVHGAEQRVAVASFRLTTLGRLARLAPELSRIVLVDEFDREPIALARAVDAIALMTTLEVLDAFPHAVDELHADGYAVMLYTLNSDEEWQRALALGVDGIATDRAAVLAERLAASGG